MSNIYKTPETYDSQDPRPKVSWKDYFYASQYIKARKDKYIFSTIFLSIMVVIAITATIFTNRFDSLPFLAGVFVGLASQAILTAWLWASVEKFHQWDQMEEAVSDYKNR